MSQAAHSAFTFRDNEVATLPSEDPASHRKRRGHVRVAVVGYGYWGSKHVRVLSSTPGVDVTIVDGVPERLAGAAAQYPSARLAHSLEAVLGSIDAVVIATPPATHAALALRAIDAGKHVLVEKPTGHVRRGRGDSWSRPLPGSASPLMVGHTFEYNPAVWKLRDLVRSGELGTILYVDTARLSLGRYQSDVNVVWDLARTTSRSSPSSSTRCRRCTAVWAHSNISRQHADVAYLRLDFPVSPDTRLRPRQLAEPQQGAPRDRRRRAEDGRLRRHVGQRAHPDLRHRRRRRTRSTPRRTRTPCPSPTGPATSSRPTSRSTSRCWSRTSTSSSASAPALQPRRRVSAAWTIVRVLAATDELSGVAGQDVVTGAAASTGQPTPERAAGVGRRSHAPAGAGAAARPRPRTGSRSSTFQGSPRWCGRSSTAAGSRCSPTATSSAVPR